MSQYDKEASEIGHHIKLEDSLCVHKIFLKNEVAWHTSLRPILLILYGFVRPGEQCSQTILTILWVQEKKIKHEPSIKNIFFQKAYKAYARKIHKHTSSIIL